MFYVIASVIKLNLHDVIQQCQESELPHLVLPLPRYDAVILFASRSPSYLPSKFILTNSLLAHSFATSFIV